MGVTGGAWGVQNVASCIAGGEGGDCLLFFGTGGWDAVKTGVSLTSSGRLGQMLTTQG